MSYNIIRGVIRTVRRPWDFTSSWSSFRRCLGEIDRELLKCRRSLRNILGAVYPLSQHVPSPKKRKREKRESDNKQNVRYCCILGTQISWASLLWAPYEITCTSDPSILCSLRVRNTWAQNCSPYFLFSTPICGPAYQRVG